MDERFYRGARPKPQDFKELAALGIKTVFHDNEKNDIAALLETLETLGIVARDA